MMVKSYKINEQWGINCITYDNGTMGLEVVMLTVPWLEVVDSVYKITDKTEANNKFKELSAKYKNLTGGLIPQEV